MVATHDDYYWGAFQLVSRTTLLEVARLRFTCFHGAFVMQAAHLPRFPFYIDFSFALKHPRGVALQCHCLAFGGTFRVDPFPCRIGHGTLTASGGHSDEQ